MRPRYWGVTYRRWAGPRKWLGTVWNMNSFRYARPRCVRPVV